MNKSNLKDLFLASLVDDDQRVVKSSKTSRKPNYFGYVNSKYESLLANQIGCQVDKRKVIEECIHRVESINPKEYLTTLRDSMTKFVYNLSFLMDCRDLNVEPLSAAQNIIILNRQAKVLKLGLKHVFNGKIDLLKDAIFTETELAEAKFGGVENHASETQKSQLSTLIGKAMNILPDSDMVSE